MTGRVRRLPFRALPVLTALASLVCLGALAAPSPFGVGVPDAPPPTSGWSGWLAAQGGQVFRDLTSALKQWRTSPSAPWSLIGLSLAYGVVHAALPGHGKVVISSYLFATGETLRKGIGLAFASAMVQALAAILLVAVLAGLIGATAATTDALTLVLTRASYLAILALGLWLVWRKGRGLWRVARAGSPLHAHHDGCGHLPSPSGSSSTATALGAILSVGLRPCSGAVLALVFALSQGLFLAGIAATFAMALGTAVTVALIASLAVGAKSLAVRLAGPSSRAGAVLSAGAELLAALILASLGLLLLAGGWNISA